MPLPQEEARRLALAWASTYSDLPEGWRLTPGAPLEDASWDFKVRYAHPEYGMNLMLMHFRVCEDGSVDMRSDKREKVALMLSAPEGFAREVRFFKVLGNPVPETPEWLLKVKRANSFVDMRGIDGFAHISVSDERLKLPFQLKSSKGGREHFFKKYPDHKDIVAVVIVDDYSSDHQLHLRLYSALGETRSKVLKGTLSANEVRKRVTACIQRTAQ